MKVRTASLSVCFGCDHPHEGAGVPAVLREGVGHEGGEFEHLGGGGTEEVVRGGALGCEDGGCALCVWGLGEVCREGKKRRR